MKESPSHEPATGPAACSLMLWGTAASLTSGVLSLLVLCVVVWILRAEVGAIGSQMPGDRRDEGRPAHVGVSDSGSALLAGALAR